MSHQAEQSIVLGSVKGLAVASPLRGSALDPACARCREHNEVAEVDEANRIVGRRNLDVEPEHPD